MNGISFRYFTFLERRIIRRRIIPPSSWALRCFQRLGQIQSRQEGKSQGDEGLDLVEDGMGHDSVRISWACCEAVEEEGGESGDGVVGRVEEGAVG